MLEQTTDPKLTPIQAIWGTTQDVMTLICCKRTKLNELRKTDKSFPKPVELSPNHLRWNLSEVREWVAAKEASRS